MANRWFLYISELAQKAQQEVTRTPENWQKFLTTASRFYKSYDFDDQLLIYIQRPDAVACADIETWNNKMHRWVNAGSNAIGLIRKGTGGRPYIQNVHDVSDTHRVKGGKDPWLWRMEETLTRYGRAREKYLMEHRKAAYTAMLLKGTLWAHLTEIDQAANQQVESVMAELAMSEGVTEELKAANQMEWVQRMNNIRQRAEEIVMADLIYS